MAIHDPTYVPWEGMPEPRWRRIAAMARLDFLLPFRSPWVLVAVLFAFTLVGSLLLILFFAASSQILPPFAAGNRIYRERFYNNPMLLTLLVALSATVGAPMIARDLRHRALLLYFSRAITRLDYLAAKLAALSGFLLLVTLGPGLLLWLGQAGMTTERIPFLQRIGDLGAVAVHSAILSIPMASVVLAFSSLTSRASLAALLWAGFYFSGQAFSRGLSGLLKAEWPKLLDWGNLTAQLGDYFYPGEAVRRPLETGWIEPLVILGGLMAAALAVAIRRLRSVEAEE